MPLTIKFDAIRRIPWYWLLVVLVMLGGAVLMFVQPRQPISPVMHSQWIRVGPSPLESRLGLVGRIEASEYLTVAAPFDGVVESMATAIGQRAERGQQLLVLDTRQLDVQLRQAQAEKLKAWRAVQDMNHWEQGQEVARARRSLNSSRLGLSDTERKLLETQGLLKRGIVPRMEVDALEQQAKVQRLELGAAEAELSSVLDRGKGENRLIAQMELKNTQSRYEALQALEAQHEIKAPFSGIVLRPQGAVGNVAQFPVVQVGARVAQGMPLFELANLEKLQAVARVNEADLHQLHEGQSVEVSGDGFDGLMLVGRVESIGVKAVATETSGVGASYEVIVSLAPLNIEQQQRVRLGMSARLSIVTYRNESALVVPPQALYDCHKQEKCASYRSDMTQPPRQVILGLGRAVPLGIEVSGLPAGYVEVGE